MDNKKKQELKKYIEDCKTELKSIGKPTSLTWELIIQTKALLYEGQFQSYIYHGFGIPKPTWESWKQKGEALMMKIQNKEKKLTDLTKAEEMYIYFAYIVAVGKSKAIQKHLRNVADAGRHDWRASKWYLEVANRKLFGDETKTTITGNLTMSDIMTKYNNRIENEKD